MYEVVKSIKIGVVLNFLPFITKKDDEWDILLRATSNTKHYTW